MSRSELYSNAVAEYVTSERYLGVRERLDAVYGGADANLRLGAAPGNVRLRLVLAL
jgi:hypothetical protein